MSYENLSFGIRIRKPKDQILDIFFEGERELEGWMEALERVCKFYHFKEDYRLLYKIGSGHFGTVFAALHFPSGETHAVKVLPKSIRPIIENEVEILKILNVPHTSRILKVYEDQIQAYVVMELAPGVDLQSYLERHGAVEERTAQKVVFLLAEILAQVHSKGVIHRDLKPQNIMVDIRKSKWVSSVTLVDFGLAVRADIVKAGSCSGTAGYIAPEQLRQESFDAKADVFSLGVVAYTLISGENPFSGENERRVAFLNSRCKVHFGSKVWSAVSPECVEFVRCLTLASPSARPTAETALCLPWLSALARVCTKPQARVATELSSSSTASKCTELSFSLSP